MANRNDLIPLIVRPPSFFPLLDAGNQIMMETLWNTDDIPKSDKLKFTDNFMKTQSDQIRKEYRRWRFKVDRETIPEFVNNQTPKVKATLIKILERQPSLEKFYKKVFKMRASLTNYDEFQEWANSEYLETQNFSNRQYPWLKKSIFLLVLLCSFLLVGVVILVLLQNRQTESGNSLKIDQSTQSNRRDKTLFHLLYENNNIYEGRICLFDSHTNFVEQIAKFHNYAPRQVITTQDKIFGVDDKSKSFEIYYLDTRIVSRGPDPPEWRQWASVAYFKDKLYYLGGGYSDRVDILIDGKWQTGPTFPLPISETQTITCDEILYVIDGWGSRKIYRLSDDEREWIEIGEVPEKRDDFGAASLNGRIYITGGLNNGEVLKSCLYFDPSAPVDSRISQIANMNYARWFHSLIVANGKLYAIGGSQNIEKKSNGLYYGSNFCDVIEEYDPQMNEWREVGKLA